MGPLAEHTLVIPTFNRPGLLRRLVAYYGASAPGMPLLILDSSAPDVTEQNAAMMAQYSPLGRHIAFPTTIPMAEKLSLGLANVTTPTASLCADDDVVFPKALPPAIEVVTRQKDYVCAHGVYINFQQIEDSSLLISMEYAGRSNIAEHPGARIFRLCQHYESLFYGVFRTSDLQEIFKESAVLPSLHFQELMQSIAALTKGKVMRLTHFYAGRRSGPVAEPERTRWQTYYWFADDADELIAHYAEYRNHAWNYYKRHHEDDSRIRMCRKDFDQLMNLSHSMYFANNCPPRYFYDRLQRLWPNDPFIDIDSPIVGPKSDAENRRFDRVLQRFYFAMERLARRDRPSLVGSIWLWCQRCCNPAARLLEEAVASNIGRRWRLQFAVGSQWLSENRDFERTLGELCRYLAEPQD